VSFQKKEKILEDRGIEKYLEHFIVEKKDKAALREVDK